MKYQLTRHSTVAWGCLRDACQTLHGNVVQVVHVAGGWTNYEETTTVHLLINGSWLLNTVTVEERRYGLTTTRLPDLTWNMGTNCTPHTCIANCSQTASVSSIVTIDSLYELQIPYPMVPSQIFYGHLFFQNRSYFYPKISMLHLQAINGMVTVNRL